MYKKITLTILVTALLIGTLRLIGQERGQQRPAAREADRWTQRAEREGWIETESPERGTPEWREQVQRRQRLRAQQDEQMMQEPPVRREGIPQPGPRIAWRQIKLIRQRFGVWLDELTRAYKDNDRERIGQLIRKMQQFRKQLHQQGPAFRKEAWTLRGEPWRQRNQPPAGGEFREGPEWPDRGPQDRGLDMPGRGYRRGRADLPGLQVPQPPSMRRPAETRQPDNVTEPPISRGLGRRNQPITPQKPLEPNSSEPVPQAPEQ